jgi:hypothetical protein
MTEPTVESLKAENERLRTVLDDLLQEKGLSERMGRLRFELRIIAYMVNVISNRVLEQRQRAAQRRGTTFSFFDTELHSLLQMLAGRITKAEQELPPETRSSAPAVSKRDIERAAFGWLTDDRGDAVRVE